MKKAFRKIVTLLSFVLCSAAASASWGANYYIDPAGSNTSGNGSQTSPWQTLSYACTKATAAGDVININAGTYTDNSTCKLATGVSIKGAGKSSVTIKSAYTGSIGTGYIYRQTTPTNPIAHGNNEISGFTLDGSGKTLTTGIFIRGYDNLNIHDIKFQNIKSNAMIIHGYYDWANKSTTPPPAYGLNNVIHDIETYDTTTVSDLGWGARLGAITLGALGNAQVYNLTINENFASRGTGVKAVAGWLKGFKGYNWNIRTDVTNGDAFVFEMYNFCGDSEIYDSTFYHALSLNSGPQTPITGSTWNLKIHDTKTDFTVFTTRSALGHELSHNYLDFYNNYIFGNKGRGAGLWTTNYLTASSVNNWRFRNNVVANCAAGGLTIERGALSNISIYNNVFDTISNSPYGGYGVSTEGFSGSLSGLKIQNNVFMNCMAAPVYIVSTLSNTLIDHNMFYGNGNGNSVKNSSGSTTISNNTVAAPGMNKSGSKPTPYYVPLSASNMIDTGINIGLPFGGKAPDLGAYEMSFPSAPSNLTVSQ